MAGWLAVLLFLHGNAILKKEDPIQDTQTDAILYDQKMEQEKDGVKAAATPKVIYYGGQGFLTKSGLAKNEQESSAGAQKKKKQSFSWSDWWEEKPGEKESQTDAGEEADLLTQDTALTDEKPDDEKLENASGGDAAPAVKDDFWDEKSPSDEVAPATNIPPELTEEPAAPSKEDDWW